MSCVFCDIAASSTPANVVQRWSDAIALRGLDGAGIDIYERD